MNTSEKNAKVLWIAPNLNHYKKRFLTRLVEDGWIDLVVLAGRLSNKEGHKGDEVPAPFDIVETSPTKRWFTFHPVSYTQISKLLRKGNFDCMILPCEKKFLPIILWSMFLRLIYGTQIVGYNHPLVRSHKDRITPADYIWTRKMFQLFDHIILYTEEARDWAVAQALLPADKASFANNTLDTDHIWQNYKFEINHGRPLTLLFIGRLIKSKKIELLLDYFSALKQDIPELKLNIIGDGPEAEVIRSATKEDPDISWRGALVDEVEIAGEMRTAHAVFIPGESGLSIVHAFAYGKPYITCDLSGLAHGPELTYLRDGKNGLMLNGTRVENLDRIKTLLTEPEKYENSCQEAFATAQNLSIKRWCEQMTAALTIAAGKKSRVLFERTVQ